MQTNSQSGNNQCLSWSRHKKKRKRGDLLVAYTRGPCTRVTTLYDAPRPSPWLADCETAEGSGAMPLLSGNLLGMLCGSGEFKGPYLDSPCWFEPRGGRSSIGPQSCPDQQIRYWSWRNCRRQWHCLVRFNTRDLQTTWKNGLLS